MLKGPKMSDELESRVTGVETNLKNLSGNIDRLTNEWSTQSQKLSGEIDKLFEQFSNFAAKVGRPDWTVIGMMGGGIITLLTAVGGMAIAPLYLIYIFQQGQIKEAHDWQTDYMQGKIPSAAQGAIDASHAELEAFKARFVENEAYMVKGIDRNMSRIDRLEDQACHK